jgi:membrane protein
MAWKPLAELRALLARPSAAPLRRRVAYPLFVARVGIQLGKQWARDRCPQIAAALAFESALTLVPMLAVTSALLEATGALDAQSTLVHYLTGTVFPAIGEDPFEHLMAFVRNVRKGALGPFGLAFTLGLAYTLFHSVENVFGQIWRIERGRTLLGKFMVFYTLATLVPFLLAISLYHTARYWTGGWRGALFSFCAIWVALALANKLLPRVPVRWRAAFAGATISALLFELCKQIFTRYLTAVALAKYRGVYGGMAIIPITLVWIYVVWIVILFGAECAHAAQNLHILEALERRARGIGDDKVSGPVALRVAAQVAVHFRGGGRALDEEALAAQLGLDEEVLTRVVARLKGAGVLCAVSGEASGLLLARPAEHIPVDEILAPFRAQDVHAPAGTPGVDALLRALEVARQAQVANLTLGQLIEGGPATMVKGARAGG